MTFRLNLICLIIVYNRLTKIYHFRAKIFPKENIPVFILSKREDKWDHLPTAIFKFSVYLKHVGVRSVAQFSSHQQGLLLHYMSCYKYFASPFPSCLSYNYNFMSGIGVVTAL